MCILYRPRFSGCGHMGTEFRVTCTDALRRGFSCHRPVRTSSPRDRETLCPNCDRLDQVRLTECANSLNWVILNAISISWYLGTRLLTRNHINFWRMWQFRKSLGADFRVAARWIIQKLQNAITLLAMSTSAFLYLVFDPKFQLRFYTVQACSRKFFTRLVHIPQLTRPAWGPILDPVVTTTWDQYEFTTGDVLEAYCVPILVVAYTFFPQTSVTEYLNVVTRYLALLQIARIYTDLFNQIWPRSRTLIRISMLAGMLGIFLVNYSLTGLNSSSSTILSRNKWMLYGLLRFAPHIRRAIVVSLAAAEVGLPGAPRQRDIPKVWARMLNISWGILWSPVWLPKAAYDCVERKLKDEVEEDVTVAQEEQKAEEEFLRKEVLTPESERFSNDTFVHCRHGSHDRVRSRHTGSAYSRPKLQGFFADPLR